MSEKLMPSEDKKGKAPSPQKQGMDKQPAEGPNPANPIASLQQQIGNQAVQRLIVQRQAGPTETDEQIASQIDQLRGSGQTLDRSVQRELGAKMGGDFSGVNVHTSNQADDLNQRLGARAFTTGQDIFFRQNEYDPHSQGGKELLAHELAHVVQQREGDLAGPAGRMVVNPPDDAFERQADAIARQVSAPATPRAEENEEQLQAQAIQRQEMPEEEELLQAKASQRQELEEEEELQAKPLQRQEEEELVMPKAIQRQEELEEEEALQAKIIQRQEIPEDEELLQGKRS